MNFLSQLLTNSANIMRMNLQMLQKNTHQQEKDPQPSAEINVLQQNLLQNLILAQQLKSVQTPQQQQMALTNKSKKISKRVNECGHSDKEHYAKGMCNNCYHKFGRNKKPWICGHEKLYAQGLCQNCYINKYNQKRRTNEKIEEKEEEPDN
ncbi:hypothetical protein pb186bvf_007337 [Paramecium bursaria]